MIRKALLEDVLQKALSTGADFAEVYVEYTKSNGVSMLGGKVELIVSQKRTMSGAVSAVDTVHPFSSLSSDVAVEPRNLLRRTTLAKAMLQNLHPPHRPQHPALLFPDAAWPGRLSAASP